MIDEVLRQPENFEIDKQSPVGRFRVPCQREVDTISLVGGLHDGDDGRDVHAYCRMEAYDCYPTILEWIDTRFPFGVARIMIARLAPGRQVYEHFDRGAYYAVRDRYHLVLQGQYDYTIDGETYEVEEGDFFWFNNQLFHSAKSTGDSDRITVIFDVDRTCYYMEHTNVLLAKALR